MSDRQSQAHSTRWPSFNGQFKNVLRLNRDHKKCYYLPEGDGVPRTYSKMRLSNQNMKALIVAATPGLGETPQEVIMK
jgi:hypothetical protein